jgi:NtrC-family two-component system sensor histidine kinase KinB
MLRTRLYLGLLPLLLLIIATGGYAIYVGRDLAGSLSRDLVNNYRAIIAAQQMRTAVTLMNTAISQMPLGDTEKQMFEENRGVFHRDLTDQAHVSAGSPRARVVAEVEAEFAQLRQRGERLLRAGGSGAIQDLLENNRALTRVLGALDHLTQHDVAAAQNTAARVEQLATAT